VCYVDKILLVSVNYPNYKNKYELNRLEYVKACEAVTSSPDLFLVKTDERITLCHN
jgi:hypothetical protein